MEHEVSVLRRKGVDSEMSTRDNRHGAMLWAYTKEWKSSSERERNSVAPTVFMIQLQEEEV